MITQPSGRFRFQSSSQSIGSRLLVSVRSADEAVQAVRGGADILDVKEPDLGSLGMADLAAIQSIAERMDLVHAKIPLSVALGELRDWLARDQFPLLPTTVQYAKLGLSEMADQPNWRSEWCRIRALISRSRPSLQWVAVAYADHIAARSPALDDVLNAATIDDETPESGCAGLLIDTFTKNGSTLLDYFSIAELQGIARDCHANGLFLAVAGSLTLPAIRELGAADADIIAVRSAACRNGNRRAEIDESQVTAISQIIRGK